MARARIVAADAWSRVAAEHVAEGIRTHVADRGRCHLALAGGGTPLPVYAAMVQVDLPWEQVEIWFGDERCVPPDHPDSNYGAARTVLLDHIPSTVHRMRGEDPDRQRAADAYAAELPERLDLVLLGMGGDGHTASLFPGQNPDGRVAPVVGPKPPPHRLTLTAPVIERARQIVVLVTGSDKAATVARALTGPSGTLPIQVARNGDWILDTDAAAHLEEATWPRSD